MMISPFTVSQSALMKRINHKLAHEGQRLHKKRGRRFREQSGDYYLMNFVRNTDVAMHVDPERLGRELGVLSEYETVASDDQGARS